MVRRDGLRLTSFLRLADGQSTYSVESAVAQNFLSSASLLNSGILFLISLVDHGFIPVPVPGGDYPYEASPEGERYKQPSASACLPEYVISPLALRRPDVATRDQWFLKEDAFGFLRGHPVPFPVLRGIGLVPVKPGAILQRIGCRHNFSI
jgi:hypothetical protein